MSTYCCGLARTLGGGIVSGAGIVAGGGIVNVGGISIEAGIGMLGGGETMPSVGFCGVVGKLVVRMAGLAGRVPAFGAGYGGVNDDPVFPGGWLGAMKPAGTVWFDWLGT